MDTIFKGDLSSSGGRRNAWVDSLLVDHALIRLVWRNFAAVVPGRLYRSNHPTPGQLATDARRHGIRTLINLRGPCANGSDALSREAASRLGLHFIDFPLRSRKPPTRDTLLRLIALLQTMREPALVHCKSGIDRAGFAAGVFLLCHGAPTAQAIAQLSLRRGHLARSSAGVLRRVFQRYAAEAEGRIPFPDWVRDAYDPAAIQAGQPASRTATWLNDRLLARE
jgi:protein tyrosine/serine phosphatase